VLDEDYNSLTLITGQIKKLDANRNCKKQMVAVCEAEMFPHLQVAAMERTKVRKDGSCPGSNLKSWMHLRVNLICIYFFLATKIQ